MNRCILPVILLLTTYLVLSPAAQAEEQVFRIGMIGLDTSHVIDFTRHIHDPNNDYGCRVVVGYPGGSADIEASASRVDKYTEQLRDEFGVEIVDTIEELCETVDGVILMSIDGRVHLEQIKPVIAAAKPIYIDKPMAASLADVIEIFRLAREADVPCWSSSSLRYCPGIIGMRNNEDVGEVLGCDAFSPCSLEEHHPDLYWYGVHGVEILFTIMGPGCETVRRVQTEDGEFVVGIWEDGRTGMFRGLRAGPHEYGATVFGSKAIMPSGRFTGYGPLVEEIIKFFKSDKVPVPPEETVEIFAFMSAADESKRKGGAAVSIQSVIENAKRKIKKERAKMNFTGAEGEVKLMTLDPGHFHAALVQKTMYDQVWPVVHVYAPAGADVDDHLRRIEGFNSRAENPTNWQQKVYTGDDFLERMLAERPGNVVVISGNNKKKAEYIKACIQAGLNVFADKPLCIDGAGFELVQEAFALAGENGVLLYDMMTERSEITTILQKELVHNEAVFGQLKKGSVDDPSVVKESVHHFFKYVSGNPIKRPGWYFDTTQQGEGIVDVTTHLADLVMWEILPEQPIDYRTDIEIKKAQRWPTMITKEQYQKATRLDDWPDFLRDKLDEKGRLACYANGEILYTLRGVHSRVCVKWNFQAPEGTGDTHFSVMKGTKASVIIRQGKEQQFRPQLYIEPAPGANTEELSKALSEAVASLQAKYPGLALEKQDRAWQLLIPDEYRIGHEAHFRQVTERYLRYLVDGKLPEWEVSNMIAKYYTTTKALESAATIKRSNEPVEFVQADDKIDVLVGGKHFTSYLYSGQLTKPILFPVLTPSGIAVNRSYPLKEIRGESRDHPHHVGILFTYDQVNDAGFWNNTTSPPQIKHIKVAQMSPGTGRGTLSTVADWVGKDGQVLLEETRTMVFYAAEDEYAIDFFIDLTAQDRNVVFTDTKEGMFAIRVADWLRETETGRYLNSNGERSEKNVWGSRARWVRLEGERDSRTVGIAIFNHPDSINYPTYWHARGYGLFSANPLGQLAFQKGRQKDNPQPLNLVLKPGETARFGFRVVIYEGARTRDELEQQFEQFAIQ
jgi:predicted dehydrogenase